MMLTASTTFRQPGSEISLTLLSFLLIILTGCAASNKPTNTAPDFVGFISQLIPGENDDQPDQIVVESQGDKVVQKLRITITPDTALFHHTAGKTNPTNFENLPQRQWVHLWLADQPLGDEENSLTATQITLFDPEDRDAIFGEIGTLTGNVTIGPLSPVAREGVTEPTPMPEVYTSRSIVIYEEDGQTEVKRVPFKPDGTYKIFLLPGDYVVDIGRSGIDSAADLPKSVHINARQVTQLDIAIDTGIR